jgi:RNA polymerase sigma-70 factor, ECF subfamily
MPLVNPFRLFIPAAPLSGCTAAAARIAGRLQPWTSPASITVGMTGEIEQLVRARKYDQALEQILQTYQGKVFRMAVVILRDAGRAEEVTQDIFLKLWRALPAYDGRAAVSTWLYAIARNSCLSAVRAEGYRRTSALDEVTEPGASSNTPLELSVGQCVERLPELQRQVITLFYLEDRSVSDVAALLDLPENTVKSHLHRARRALGEMMK